MFETIAALSTLGFLVIFVALFQMDRASRRADAEQQTARKLDS